MDKRKRLVFFLAGPIFTLIAGTLLHFVHDWFPSNLTAVFSAVNESTWEHSRLVSVPMLLASLWEYPLCPNRERFWLAKALGCWTGVLAVPTLFYTYSGIAGGNVLWADIAVFAVSVLLGYAVFFRLLRADWTERPALRALGVVLFVLLAVLDVWWTFAPPHIALFRDPTNGLYGIV